MININLKELRVGKNETTKVIDGQEYEVTVFVRAILEKGNFPYRDGEWLRQRYIDDGMTMMAIANTCGVSAMCINDWLKRHDIQTRSRGAPKLA
jgi:hypothetical protein